MTSAAPRQSDILRTLRWPAEKFYWAIIDAPGVMVRGELPAAFRDELQDAVPLPVESLHAVCTPVNRSGSSGLAVCAVPHDALREVPASARLLVPEAVPQFLLGCDPDDLNLLVGTHEPQVMRRERRRMAFTLAASIALAVVLACTGLVRRGSAWNHGAEEARSAYDQLLTTSAIKLNVNDPFALQREIDRLKRQTDASALPASTPDASLALTALLRSWPVDVDAQPKSIGIRPEGVSMTVEINGDANGFLDAFRAPAGWTLDEPRVSNVRGISTLNLQLRPSTAKLPTRRNGGGS